MQFVRVFAFGDSLTREVSGSRLERCSLRRKMCVLFSAMFLNDARITTSL